MKTQPEEFDLVILGGGTGSTIAAWTYLEILRQSEMAYERKNTGAVALLIPNIPFNIKEFAYLGFDITLISASIAHFARGVARLSVLFIIDRLVFLSLLILSYVYFRKSYSLSEKAKL